MRFSIFALATTLAVASAQSLGDIPTCALTCFSIAVPASGCSLTDQECQCTTGKKSIEKSIAECVPSKCSNEDILSTYPLPSPLYPSTPNHSGRPNNSDYLYLVLYVLG